MTTIQQTPKSGKLTKGRRMKRRRDLLETSEPFDGILNVYKPSGWTSHDVVAALRTRLGQEKVGHAGTLDPAATGVLPVLLGKATKISSYLMDWEKEYRAVLRLGQSTDTQDATGVVISEACPEGISEESIYATVNQFYGRIEQIPPMYSAIKVAGRPLYKAARAGQIVERAPRFVTIHHIEVQSIHGPDVALCVRTSKGTYIRTLCADIGQRLGVGGHMRELIRSRVGPLCLEQALPLAQWSRSCLQNENPLTRLTLDQALAFLPAVIVDPAMVSLVLHGTPVPHSAIVYEKPLESSSLENEHMVRVKDRNGCLLALGKSSVDTGGPQGGEARLAIVRLLVDQSRDGMLAR